VSHPLVKVELLTMLSEHQHIELQTGRIQIGVSRYLSPVAPVEGLTFTRLLDDPFVAALPATHRLPSASPCARQSWTTRRSSPIRKTRKAASPNTRWRCCARPAASLP
jgi:DNA-binding transcriptional LysR family regulator